MISSILEFNFMGTMLILLTMLFIVVDKAFPRKYRFLFHLTTFLSLYMTLLCNIAFSSDKVGMNSIFVKASEYIARPIILVILCYLAIKISRTQLEKNVTLVVIGGIAISLFFENSQTPLNLFNNVICIIVAGIYFYNVFQIYKRDGLTGLFLRNTLNFDMEDLERKKYHLVLIDVDNFKLINDKYGHDKGDEVLVTIVRAIERHLIGGCKLYRYGGDEFVVISKKVEPEQLMSLFEEVNSDLAADELRVSYSIVTHEANDDGNVSLVEADKRMYENKKLLKSEDIWDDMTGLYNFRGFIDELDLFRKSVVRDGNSVCLLSVDIDRLSNINMAYGYVEGNLAIKTLARILKSCLKGRDFIGHLGSDEFLVAVECKGDDDQRLDLFINELHEGIGSAYEFAAKDYSVKINVAKFFISDTDSTGSADLINDALYTKQSEKEDRRKSDLIDDDQDTNDQEEALVKDILDNNRFKYAFQPIVSAKTGEIVAYESLMRSATETMISPLKILKYAERNKRLYDVEKFTFSNILAHIKSTNCIAEGRRIFINSIPGYMLSDEDYLKLKEEYHELFERMVIEITEQREVDDEALATLNIRRDSCGFNLAIDDYGSGCSNTNSLLRYMPQIVKVDRLLITGIDRNAKKQFFVNSIISFARDNDMMILAEGVETESELKTVIRLGVDMVQGFFTAKPSFEILDEIPKDIKKIIVDENMKVSGNQRMVYTASTNCELSVVYLAMEDYSKINISSEYVTLIGNPEYTADMVIRIKDGTDCVLTLNNVFLNSVDDEPCIEIGEGANLTLVLEGDNKLNAKGIHVPEGSSLRVKGSGNLDIAAKGHECYAIGSDSESGFGKMTFNNSGDIAINVDGENCTGIGGGIGGENSEINMLSGSYVVNVAGVDSVGIGAHKGNFPLHIKDCNITSDFRVNTGIVIGTIDGEQNIVIENFDLKIEGSGTAVSGIGSINQTHGSIKLSSGSYAVDLKGQRLFLLGCNEGELDISVSHVKVDMMGEGDSVVGFGSKDKKSHLAGNDCFLSLIINASSPLAFGISEEDPGFRGPLVKAVINGEELVMQH